MIFCTNRIAKNIMMSLSVSAGFLVAACGHNFVANNSGSETLGAATPIDTERGDRVASDSESHSIGAFTGHCYQYVANTLERQGIIGANEWGGIGTESAYMFGNWANANPNTLLGRGYKRVYPTLTEVPVGSIIVWGAGVCGHSAAHGHIEVVTSPGRACSDGCRSIPVSCGVSGTSIFAPVQL